MNVYEVLCWKNQPISDNDSPDAAIPFTMHIEIGFNAEAMKFKNDYQLSSSILDILRYKRFKYSPIQTIIQV